MLPLIRVFQLVTSLRMFVLPGSVAKNQGALLITKIQGYYQGKYHLCAITGVELDPMHLERALLGVWEASYPIKDLRVL